MKRLITIQPIRQIVKYTLAWRRPAAAIASLLISATYLLPVSAAALSGNNSLTYNSGITGTTYTRKCDSNNVCSDVAGPLSIYVYAPNSTNALMSFNSSSNGFFTKSLASGSYVLKGSPVCYLGPCLQPSGNVKIFVLKNYLSLKLVYIPGVGLSGGTN